MQKVLIETSSGDVLACAEEFDFTQYPGYNSSTHTIREHPTPLKCHDAHHNTEFHRWNGTEYTIVQVPQSEKDADMLSTLKLDPAKFKVANGLITLV